MITEVEANSSFQVTIPDHYTIEALRVEAKEKFGRAIHIRAKIGPTVIDEAGGSLTCPIEAVDDECLQGDFSLLVPVEGYCLYIGYFLPHSNES